ncbi:hypothetical protein TraAM80_07832 [Trypanosoma rangeli]|uniref:Uncharacterized protein n=1 Tax=Trypanosoma rangeli TaxID=5698 RepID=A0A3R7K3Y6_TRYRA|nr:uncharacterized protein TraAM80_07832 [Trypanosoma rangeli]RNF00056.1 hypothetical protein TraAM80_07832 [Trypanosoma rangeli]|eukprot:RNF00056.1 hypothetical protein TraAM80_07832 [Trypanosoma rangeli]
MRIELPRSIVWRWAEANGFVSELGGVESFTHGEMDKPCTLIEQLREPDMMHFLQSVAPMVAASRRARSASRMSSTEPLPLTYYPPSPEAGSVATTEQTCEADDDACLSENSDDNDNSGGMYASNENVLAACRSQSAATTTLRNFSPVAGAASVVSAGSHHKEGREKRENFAPPTVKTTPVASINTTNEQRREEGEEEDGLSRCLEALGTEMDTSAVHLVRGFSSQNSALLALLTVQKGERGAAVCDGGSEAVVSSTPPPPSLSSRDLQRAGQLPGKEKPRRRTVTRRRQPHVGDCDEEVGATPKRTRKDKSPTPSPLAGSTKVGEVNAATGAMDRASQAESSAAGAPHDPLPATLNNAIPPSAVAAAPCAGRDVVPMRHSISTTGERNAAALNFTAGAAYNFADFMTAPENAAHLPLLPDVKKVLLDLEGMLPPKRRRRGTGETKVSRPPSKRGAAGGEQRKTPAKGRRKGKEVISEGKLKASTTAQPLLPMAGDCARALPRVPEAFEAAAAADFGDIVISSPAAASTKMGLSDVLEHGPYIQSPVLPARQNSRQSSVTDCPKAGHTSDTAASNCCVPSTCVTPMSEYHLAESASRQDREPRDERNMDTGSGCAHFMRAASAAAAAATTTTPLSLRARFLGKEMDRQLIPTLLGTHAPLPFAPDSPSLHQFQQQGNKHYGMPFAVVEGDSRKNRWRRVVRQLNSLSLHLTQARACGEELRGLFLLMLEDAEV